MHCRSFASRIWKRAICRFGFASFRSRLRLLAYRVAIRLPAGVEVSLDPLAQHEAVVAEELTRWFFGSEPDEPNVRQLYIAYIFTDNVSTEKAVKEYSNSVVRPKGTETHVRVIFLRAHNGTVRRADVRR